VRRWLFEQAPRPIAIARACGITAGCIGVALIAAGQWTGYLVAACAALLLWASQ
jgi:hypothetical protein